MFALLFTLSKGVQIDISLWWPGFFFFFFFFNWRAERELQLEQMSNTSPVPSFITSDIQIVLPSSSAWFVSKCGITYEVVMTQGTDVILPGCFFFGMVSTVLSVKPLL